MQYCYKKKTWGSCNDSQMTPHTDIIVLNWSTIRWLLFGSHISSFKVTYLIVRWTKNVTLGYEKVVISIFLLYMQHEYKSPTLIEFSAYDHPIRSVAWHRRLCNYDPSNSLVISKTKKPIQFISEPNNICE